MKEAGYRQALTAIGRMHPQAGIDRPQQAETPVKLVGVRKVGVRGVRPSHAAIEAGLTAPLRLADGAQAPPQPAIPPPIAPPQPAIEVEPHAGRDAEPIAANMEAEDSQAGDLADWNDIQPQQGEKPQQDDKPQLSQT